MCASTSVSHKLLLLCWSWHVDQTVFVFQVCHVNVANKKAEEQTSSRAHRAFTERRSTNPSMTSLWGHFVNLNLRFQLNRGVDAVSTSCNDITSSQFCILYTSNVLTWLWLSELNDKHMSVDVIPWLKSLPKNKALVPTFSLTAEFSSFSLKQLTLRRLYITCVFVGELAVRREITVTHTVKATFSFLFFQSRVSCVSW